MFGLGGSFVFLVEEPNAWLPALWILVVVIVAGIFGSALWAPKRGAQRSRWWSQLFRREKDRRRTPPRGREAHPQGGSTAEMRPAAPAVAVAPAHARVDADDDRSNVAVLLYDRESEAPAPIDDAAAPLPVGGVPPRGERPLTLVGPPAGDGGSDLPPTEVVSTATAATSMDEVAGPESVVADHESVPEARSEASVAAPGAPAATPIEPTPAMVATPAPSSVADPVEPAAEIPVPTSTEPVAGPVEPTPAEPVEPTPAEPTAAFAEPTPAAPVEPTPVAPVESAPIARLAAAADDHAAAADDHAAEVTVDAEPAHAAVDPIVRPAHAAPLDTGDDEADEPVDEAASFVMLDELRHVIDGLSVNTQAFEHDLTWFLERSAVPTEMPNWPIEHQRNLAEQAATVLADPLMDLLRRARDIAETVREIDVLVGERTLASASVEELSGAVEAIARLCPDLARLRRRFDGLGADFEVLRGMADTVSGLVAIIEATLDVAAGLGGQVFDVAAAGRRFGLHVLR